jgi:catechol 2,3-dioxygenase-like lactoylglutathione lyase family enzyme
MIESHDWTLRRAARNWLVGMAFDGWTRWLRLKRRLRHLGARSIGALDHVTIPVHDLEAARRFYCGVLGAEHAMTIDAEALERFGRPPADDEGNGTFHISVYFAGGTRIDLFQQRSGQPAPTSGHPHFAFRVSPGQMLAWKVMLESHGVPTEGPLQLGFPGQASLYFDDPSGNHLELVCHRYPLPLPIRPPHLDGLAWGPSARRGGRRREAPIVTVSA